MTKTDLASLRRSFRSITGNVQRGQAAATALGRFCTIDVSAPIVVTAAHELKQTMDHIAYEAKALSEVVDVIFLLITVPRDDGESLGDKEPAESYTAAADGNDPS